MAMQTGSGNNIINMTPMIDVLLVLLIIFMAISPTKSHGLPVEVPQPAPTSEAPAEDQIVLTMTATRELWINGHATTAAGLVDALRSIYAARADRTLYIDAAGERDYGDVAALVDSARAAGVERFGLLTKHSKLSL